MMSSPREILVKRTNLFPEPRTKAIKEPSSPCMGIVKIVTNL